MKSSDSPTRSLTKAATYHSAMIVADLVIVLFLTGKLEIALGIIILTNATSALLYLTNERLWNMSHWGKSKARRR